MTHHRSERIVARAAAALAGAALLHGATAIAAPLADPTRPPAALSAPGGLAAAALPHKANRDTARAIAAAQRAADPPPPPAPVLVQAVQLPAHGPATALVDGRPVKTGDTLDGRAVLAIDAQGLLVKGPKGPERLWLLGGAPKLAAGSITQSRTARYQAAPPAEPGLAATTDAQATAPNAGASPPAAPSSLGSTTGNTTGMTTSNTSTAPTPLSLAKRTAP